MKVFVVTTGLYSDYGIHSIWSTEELAKQCQKQLEDEGSDVNNVMVVELDKDISKLGKHQFDIEMNKQGDVLSIRKTWIYDFSKQSYSIFGRDVEIISFDIFTDTEERAIKIAGEKRREIIANNLWKKGNRGVI